MPFIQNLINEILKNFYILNRFFKASAFLLTVLISCRDKVSHRLQIDSIVLTSFSENYTGEQEISCQ